MNPDDPPPPPHSYRTQLTIGEEIVDPITWAGSVPQAYGIAPRLRVGRDRWFNLLWLLPIGFVLLIVAVAIAQGLRSTLPCTSSLNAIPAPPPAPPSRPSACLVGSPRSTSSTCSS